ncbi:hypothetical protein PI95_034585 [Hassallia byssoidea VB512170]|uniref:Uncharacterized protein n=1 Tax=Hassallia byssoidea VB512170 TaxID=1304833 RepID=A0A846HNY7_9CYAN|nr:hypothetical protein [Hassalia byssoidea]NEU77450.1 hypothetical protein [Hassalia byssoidea VB512170]
MLKGGVNSTSWQPGWKHGKTQVIRVPIALAPKILEYARALDEQAVDSDLGLQAEILQTIDRYIEHKRRNYHPNQNSKQLDTNTRAWDELRKFQAMVERGELEIGN